MRTIINWTVRNMPAMNTLPAMTFGYGVWNAEQAKYFSNWHELACVVMSLAQRLEEVSCLTFTS